MKEKPMNEEDTELHTGHSDAAIQQLAERVTHAAVVVDNSGTGQAVKPEHFLLLGEALRTQDNRSTSYPMYIVRDRRKSFCDDASDADISTWIEEDGFEVDSVLEQKLDALMYSGIGYDSERDSVILDGSTYVRAHYRITHEYVTTCITQAGADSYIRNNEHNLQAPYVYIESGYKNAEWRLLRAMLLHLGGRDFSVGK